MAEKAVTLLCRAYLEIIKPDVESRRAKLDPVRNPVQIALLDAYLERMEIFYRAGEAGADEQLITEIDELAPWVNPASEVEPDVAHGIRTSSGMSLGQMLIDAGCEYPEAWKTIEEVRKRPEGRPVGLDAVKALEMSLSGKLEREIADALCDYADVPHRHGEPRLPHKYSDQCCERFRKQIAKLRPLYDKYKSPETTTT